MTRICMPVWYSINKKCAQYYSDLYVLKKGQPVLIRPVIVSNTDTLIGTLHNRELTPGFNTDEIQNMVLLNRDGIMHKYCTM